jgi:hypothetical protein
VMYSWKDQPDYGLSSLQKLDDYRQYSIRYTFIHSLFFLAGCNHGQDQAD